MWVTFHKVQSFYEMFDKRPIASNLVDISRYCLVCNVSN